jgi:hypothetical protein
MSNKKKKTFRTRAEVMRYNLTQLRINMSAMVVKLDLMAATRGELLHRSKFKDGMLVMEQAAKIGSMRSVSGALASTVLQVNKILEIDKDAMRSRKR